MSVIFYFKSFLQVTMNLRRYRHDYIIYRWLYYNVETLKNVERYIKTISPVQAWYIGLIMCGKVNLRTCWNSRVVIGLHTFHAAEPSTLHNLPRCITFHASDPRSCTVSVFDFFNEHQWVSLYPYWSYTIIFIWLWSWVANSDWLLMLVIDSHRVCRITNIGTQHGITTS